MRLDLLPPCYDQTAVTDFEMNTSNDGASTQIFYISKSGKTTMYKFSITRQSTSVNYNTIFCIRLLIMMNQCVSIGHWS